VCVKVLVNALLGSSEVPVGNIHGRVTSSVGFVSRSGKRTEFSGNSVIYHEIFFVISGIEPFNWPFY
jgi:hypothetical protein